MPPTPDFAPVFPNHPNDPNRKPDVSEFPEPEAVIDVRWSEQEHRWIAIYKSDDEELPVAQNDADYEPSDAEVCEYDPFTDQTIKPKFSKFPDPENVIDVEWKSALGKWVAIYKSDEPIY